MLVEWSSRRRGARPPARKGRPTGQDESARERVVSTCLALLDRGYLKATEGNVSVRVPAGDAFVITPSNHDYAKMKPADIRVLGFDLEKLEGSRKASIEGGMHAAVYARRPDVNAIVHTHQPYASALALVRQPIPALFDEQVRFLGRSVEIIDDALERFERVLSSVEGV